MLDSQSRCYRWRGEGAQKGEGVQVACAEEEGVDIPLDMAVCEGRALRRRVERSYGRRGVDGGVGQEGGGHGVRGFAGQEERGAVGGDLRGYVEAGRAVADDDEFLPRVALGEAVVLGVGDGSWVGRVPFGKAGDVRNVRGVVVPCCHDDGVVG